MASLYRRPPKTGIFWLAYYHNSKLYRQSLKTKDRATANYLKNKKEQESAEGKIILPKKKLSCLPVLDEYYNLNQSRKSKSANANTYTKIKKFLEWTNIVIFNQITEKKFQEYLDYRINEDKLSLYTINHIIANIKAWLNYAVRMRYIFENPLCRVKKYKLPENPKRFLSKEELNKLLNVAKDPELYADKNPTLYSILATAVYTGMRQKELFTLEWQDIDFERNIITIRNKDGFTTKSKKFRVVPLHPQLKAVLEVTRSQNGLCFDTTNQRRIFNRILKKTGLKGIGWHILRHSFASHLVMQGVDLVAVKEILGHSNISTTLIYSHLSKDHIKNAIQKFSLS